VGQRTQTESSARQPHWVASAVERLRNEVISRRPKGCCDTKEPVRPLTARPVDVAPGGAGTADDSKGQAPGTAGTRPRVGLGSERIRFMVEAALVRG
jgi:hypothetical protein